VEPHAYLSLNPPADHMALNYEDEDDDDFVFVLDNDIFEIFTHIYFRTDEQQIKELEL
jgi:hypothetical protein